MEGTSKQENQELEYKNPDEDQGGIRRRLRDRDLLRKRKAEAEAKETNQWVFGEESQRKRPRADNKSGAKRRGRPRKTEPLPEISVSQEELTLPLVAPVELPESAEVIPDQTSGSLESQTTSVLAAPAPLQLFGSFQTPVFAPAFTSPAPVDPTPTLISPSGPSPSSTKILDTAQIPVQELAPVLVSAPGAVPVPTPGQEPVQDLGLDPTQIPVPPAAPAQVETPNTGTQDKEALNKVIIEDLGPDEEEDITLSQEKRDGEDLSGTPSFGAPEQSKIFSVPTLSSQPTPPEYLPGNSV